MSTQDIIDGWERGVEPYAKAIVRESWDSANYANPLYIVTFPDGSTLSTMQRDVAEREARDFNREQS